MLRSSNQRCGHTAACHDGGPMGLGIMAAAVKGAGEIKTGEMGVGEMEEVKEMENGPAPPASGSWT